MADILEQQGAKAEHPSAPNAAKPVTLDDFVEAEPTEAAPAAEDASAEDELPDKYKGKSVADLVQMHQEAEKLIGRQSGEVGELRNVIDQFIKQPQAQPTPAQADDDDVNWFDDPDKAVAAAINKHPAIQQAQQSAIEMKRNAAIAHLQARHPDLPTVLGDPEFMEWVKKSPVRVRLYEAADKQFDADSADELVSTWKERKQLVAQTLKSEEGARKQDVQKASTGATTGSGETSRKVYRRSDIIKLMQTDPQRYQQLQPEIMAAYAEGRVR